MLLLPLLALLASCSHAFHLPTLALARARAASSVVAAPARAAMAGRRRGQALALFSGIVEQMGTIQAVQMDKDMVLWSGDTGKGNVCATRARRRGVMDRSPLMQTLQAWS